MTQQVQCRHEAYQGACAHCRVAIKNGLAAAPASSFDPLAFLELNAQRLRSWPFQDTEYCMCGSRVDEHDMGSGHSPVSQADYAMALILKEFDEAIAQLKKASADG